MGEHKLTCEEAATIRSLQRLAQRWQRSLQLYVYEGSLRVVKPQPGQILGECVVAYVDIPSISSDPSEPSDAF